MSQVDYKKVFSKLSHIMALSHDQKFDQIVQNLITHTLNQDSGSNPKNENEVSKRIVEIYGISIRTHVIMSNLDKLLRSGEILKDPISKRFHVSQVVSNKLKQRLEVANQLTNSVKERWFEELKIHMPELTLDKLNTLWDCLCEYLSNVFEQHGIQTLQFLNPNLKINDDDQKNLDGIIESIIKKNSCSFSKEILSASINQFITDADESRTNYLSQLADSTFTSFALTADAETVNFLNQRFRRLQLFLDTNFIFGVLDLHKNSEDASAREILEEVKRNRLPFILTYHPETLSEFKRAFDARAMFIRASRWTRESSRVAIAVDGLSPLERLYHEQNIENEIDPSIFLDKYEHVDLILKDLGLIEFVPQRVTSDDEFVNIESDVEQYQIFYDSIKNRKIKTFLSFKHDVVVVREVRSLNPKKTKFLESNAFFISSDFVLAKFEKKHFKRNWEINYVVSPSIFLQLIRPFIENDYSSNKRFIDTFSIPDFRSFEIDYSTTRSKALQILNDNYHDTSFETKVKILRDQVLLSKLEKVNEDQEKQLQIVENQIAIENKILAQQKAESEANIKQFEEENKLAITAIESKETILKEKEEEIENLKTSFAVQNIELQIDNKTKLLDVLQKTIEASEKRQIPILQIIDERVKTHTFYLAIIPVLFIAAVFFCIYKFSWSVMEQWVYIVSALGVVIGYLYLAIKGESFDPIKYFKYYKNGVITKVNSEFDFNIGDLELQKSELDKIQEEIGKLQDKLAIMTLNK
jgi:hypothetical protein